MIFPRIVSPLALVGALEATGFVNRVVEYAVVHASTVTLDGEIVPHACVAAVLFALEELTG